MGDDWGETILTTREAEIRLPYPILIRVGIELGPTGSTRVFPPLGNVEHLFPEPL
jgi:hypothetical protein